jgi:aminoglycoside phosphotransferase (APT) family kinase protein
MAKHGHIKRDLDDVLKRLKAWHNGGAMITGISVLSAGHSNETFLVEGIDRVLRMPPSTGGLLPPYDMPKQHRVLDAVNKMENGPPVPRVFEVCEDPDVLGDPFFLMEKLVGEAYEYAPPDWLVTSSHEQREKMCLQWIGAVAALHDRPADDLPIEFISTRGYAEKCLQMAQVPSGHKGLVALLENFVRNPLPTSGAPAPVHGDPKIGNMMWRPDGHLVAVLDWEMSHQGEPLHDLGWALCLYDQPLASAGLDFEGWLQPPEMAAKWEEITGRSAAALDKYMVLAFAKICAITTWGAHLYISGQTKDERYAAWGEGMPQLLSILFDRADRL